MTENRTSTIIMRERESIIHNYIAGYNNFDIDLMVADFDENIRFENISHGETDLLLTGISAFKEQAIASKDFFSSRRQRVIVYRHSENETEIEVDYYAVAAIDLPNGLKKGMELKLNGKSVFTFAGKRIIGLKDIS